MLKIRLISYRKQVTASLQR